MVKTNKPEKSFKHGQCEASIFENELKLNGSIVKVKRVSFQKRYKDKDGSWKSTSSLDVNEIPKAIMALTKAYDYLTARDNNDGSETSFVP